VIRDYSLIVDRLEIETDLLLPGQELADFAAVTDGNLVFSFGAGDSLTLNAITNLGMVLDDVTFV